MAAFIDSNPHLFRNKDVLELGSGTGVAGLAASVVGAKSVVMTDLNQLLPLLQQNIRQNANVINKNTIVVAKEFIWGQDLIMPNSVVICSDVLYDPASVPALIKSLSSIKHTSHRCYLTYKSRGHAAELRAFQQIANLFELRINTRDTNVVLCEILLSD